MKREITSSLDELNSVVEYIQKVVPKSAIIFLDGDLASGKTTLTKEIAKYKGLEDEVTSPTFSLQQCYGGKLYHYDLYRIDYNEFMELGLFEEFDREGWHIVEWGSDKLKEFLLNAGYTLFNITITPISESKRKYIIEKIQ
jgi:tRNA threonylcarbamoyladenosine biosynthesis protein TsaE